jgi:hypothetical protein
MIASAQSAIRRGVRLGVLIVLLCACDGGRPIVPPIDASPTDSGTEVADAASDPIDADAIDASDPVDADLDKDAGEVPPEVTWYRDVVPVVQENCIACHRVGGIAPFSMEAYETAMPWADAMRGALIADYMPPWPPSDDCQPHLDARTVTDREKSIVVRWAELGAPAGDPADAPPPVQLEELDRIDVEADPGMDYTPVGNDDYRCFIIDPGLNQTQQLEALEISPGVRWMVHHVVLYQANAFQAESADAQEAGPGWTCFGGPGVGATSPLDSLTVGAWAPGTPVTHYPAGTGVDLSVGNVIVMQVHYHVGAGQTATADRTRIRLKLSTGLTPAYVTGIYDSTFAIPPRDPNGSVIMYSSSVSWPLTLSGTLHGVFPHMHLLGRKISLTYTPPGGGSSTCLSDIPLWSFHWQQFYFFDHAGVRLEAGGTLDLTCEWERPLEGDTIYWGEGSEDEMCIVGLYVTQ